MMWTWRSEKKLAGQILDRFGVRGRRGSQLDSLSFLLAGPGIWACSLDLMESAGLQSQQQHRLRSSSRVLAARYRQQVLSDCPSPAFSSDNSDASSSPGNMAQGKVKFWSFSGSDLLTCMLPTFCPPTNLDDFSKIYRKTLHFGGRRSLRSML